MDDEPMWAADRVVALTPGSAITIPETANEFAIKGNHLTLVKGNQFDGRTKTDPYKHIHEFLGICDMIKYRDTENEAVRLMMFSLSLTGEAKRWLDELNEGTIETWDELRTAFISRFFPPTLFDLLLGEIRAFSQHENESLTDVWLRMKEMLRNCRGHNLSKGNIIKIFYHGLNKITQEVLNVAADGIKISSLMYMLILWAEYNFAKCISMLLQQLPIPSTIWSSISVDFIEGLPSSQGKTVILSYNVFKLHGLPYFIISDMDKVFLSHFWMSLFKVLKVNLHIPKNGCNGYNTNFHSSTPTTPFEPVYDQPPPLYLPYVNGDSHVEAVDISMQAREQDVQLLKFHLQEDQDQMRNLADKHITDRQFEVGMCVYVKLLPHRQVTMRKGSYNKLSSNNYGSFQNVKKWDMLLISWSCLLPLKSTTFFMRPKSRYILIMWLLVENCQIGMMLV
ncbi:reverse transcriptase domain-containing protein [Tanacetum coccineum]|uniref:Reverse transcriptase domain-containing protein n=1 Tax=Tanacetum coccineum TaxID=301880 RepID=A0ABQ5EHX2_9ASTR